MNPPNPYMPPKSEVDDRERLHTDAPRKQLWRFTFAGAIAGSLLGGVFQWVFFQPGTSIGFGGQPQRSLDIEDIATWAVMNGLIFLILGAVLGALLDTWIQQTKKNANVP